MTNRVNLWRNDLLEMKKDRVLLITILFVARILSAAGGEQEQRRADVVVQADADELPSAYGAPPDLSHGRISTLTKSYVLAPFSVELEAGYEAAVFDHGPPGHVFRQEVELGLPARITVGLQNTVEHFEHDTRDASFALEARYAFANWEKLPLNPTFSTEYRFGLAHHLSDSSEFALLLTHDFPHQIEWALNAFLDQEWGGSCETSGGFAQSVEIPVLLPEEKLEAGIEMEYHSASEPGDSDSGKGFAVGPTVVWRPTRSARFDIASLFGCSDHAPAARIFAVLSFSIGSGADNDSEAPASVRAR